MLVERVLEFARQGNWPEILWDAETDDEIIERLNENDQLRELFVSDYKRVKWRKFNAQQFKSSMPCRTRKELARSTRNNAEKMLIMFGWHNPEGGPTGHCAYCNIEISINEMTIDHVVPKRFGGSEELDNLVPACCECNAAKGDWSVGFFLMYLGCDVESVNEWFEVTAELITQRSESGWHWKAILSKHDQARLGIQCAQSNVLGKDVAEESKR